MLGNRFSNVDSVCLRCEPRAFFPEERLAA
jgi:hypothetical protein